MPMIGFILWLVSFINGPGPEMWLTCSSTNDLPTVTTGDCPSSDCGLNGTRITGLAFAGDVSHGIRTVTLVSGEIVALQ